LQGVPDFEKCHAQSIAGVSSNERMRFKARFDSKEQAEYIYP